MPTTTPAIPVPPRARRAPKILPALLVVVLPLLGGLVLLPYTGRMRPRPVPSPDPSEVRGPWYGQQRAELAADLIGRVRLGMDAAAAKRRLGQPDWIRVVGAAPHTEMWSYWCRDSRQHFLFVNGRLASEETRPYSTQ